MAYKLSLITLIMKGKMLESPEKSQWENLIIRLESSRFPWNIFLQVSLNYQVAEYTRGLLLLLLLFVFCED